MLETIVVRRDSVIADRLGGLAILGSSRSRFAASFEMARMDSAAIVNSSECMNGILSEIRTSRLKR